LFVEALILAMVMLPEPQSDSPTSPISLVINEFMASPQASSTEAEGEWIELLNRSDEYVNLSGWRIENGYGASITLCSHLLPPGAYYVLGASDNTTRNGGYEPDFVYSSFAIPSAGSLELISPSMQSELITYNASWPVVPGSSCERINPGWVGTMASSWSQSIESFGAGDMGTPGERNSVFQNSFAENTWAFIKAFVQ
jgi:hypothetical protein